MGCSSGDSPLQFKHARHALQARQRGYDVGLAVCDDVAKPAGLDGIKDRKIARLWRRSLHGSAWLVPFAEVPRQLDDVVVKLILRVDPTVIAAE